MRMSAGLSSLSLLMVLSTGAAHAGEWPGWRGDIGRTALAQGASDVHKPAVRWRYFLGGALAAHTLIALDIDSDNKRELLHLAGGRLVAKEADDTLLWETPIMRLTSIKGAFDLTGDGIEELVVIGKGGAVHLIDPAGGGLCWSMPTGKMAQVGTVLITDLDGDKRADLYIAEHASKGPQGSALAVSFSGSCAVGKTLSAKQLWTINYTGNTPSSTNRVGTGGLWDVAADLDGDKLPEIVAMGGTQVHVYSGKTGAHLSMTKVGTHLTGGAWVMAADTDGDKQQELLFATNRAGTQRVWLMESAKGQVALTTRWERAASDETQDQHTIIHNPLQDLDGDGQLETITSFRESGTWTTFALDSSASGAAKTKASIVGEFLVGTADLDGDGRVELITSKPDASEILVRSWDKTSAKLSTAKSVKAPSGGTLVPLSQLDRNLWATQGPAMRAVAWNAILTTGARELLLLLTSGSGQTLESYDMSGSTAVIKSSHAPGTGVRILSAILTSDVGEAGIGGQLVTPRSDGYVVSLSSSLKPTNSQALGQFKRTGMRNGGFMAAFPLVADLDGDGKAEVLARDSRGMLVCIDPTGSSLVKPPKLLWEIQTQSTLRPAVADLDGDGKKEVLLDDYLKTQVVAYHHDGKKFWSYPPSSAAWTNRILVGSLLWGDVSGDKVPDVIYVVYDRSDKKRYVGALHGKLGTPVWTAKEVGHISGGCGLGIQTLKDLDGDGILDVVFTACKTILGIRGTDGTVLNPQNIQSSIVDKPPAINCGNTSGYAMVYDLDGDKKDDLLATGNYSFMCRFSPAYASGKLTLSNKWTSSPAAAYNPIYAAPAPCTAGVRLAAPVKVSNQLEVRKGSDGALVGSLTLKAGTVTGYLTSAVTHAGLAGAGSPRTLVGSDDGYLYAVDTCATTPKLDWAIQMRAPVSEAIFGDTDGDKKDEILVATEDGYLFALGKEHLPAPTFVYENDGKGPATTKAQDIDAFEHHSTLYANWSTVAGADAYEYAVITSFGSIITKPEFIKVGNTTSATATGLNLTLGQRYFFAVRALDTKNSKTSGEALSDGVLVVDNTPPTVKLEAAPNPFDPAQTTACTIKATFLDGYQLTSYQVSITDASGQTVKDWGSTAVKDYKASPTLSWDGRVAGNIKYGTYTIKAEALDTKGFKASGSLTLRLVAQDGGVTTGDMGVEAGAEAGAEAGLDAGGGKTDGPVKIDTEGCECNTSGGDATGGLVLLFTLLGLAIVRRRPQARRDV